MRNLILSAFPRSIRLPDPFTPNLKVDLLPTITEPPKIASDYKGALVDANLLKELDYYLETEQPSSYPYSLVEKLILPPDQASSGKYNLPLLNALVLHIGNVGVRSRTQGKSRGFDMTSGSIHIFLRLVQDLDAEGRYYFLNAMANQLRYPNAHTHYYSCVLLYMFGEISNEVVLEQITRVLLERLIVNRPHPWGLLITFIELIKNKRYKFWDQEFTRLTSELNALFSQVRESIERS
ncbi:hypothetical protein GEMRC1_006587 [Eukaryota sp. GEM-RC1]